MVNAFNNSIISIKLLFFIAVRALRFDSPFYHDLF